MSQTAIEFQNVTKQFDNAALPSVDQVSLTIEEGEFITILGSSGSGKTTLLKMVNRLYEPTGGKIFLFGEDISTVDVVKVRRRIGYVIQQIGLFPHMTIADNISVVPKLLNWDKKQTDDRVDELLNLVGLLPEEFKHRYPSQLSGGLGTILFDGLRTLNVVKILWGTVLSAGLAIALNAGLERIERRL